MFIKNSISTQKFQSAKKAASAAKKPSSKTPKEGSFGAQYADTLVRANDNLLPNFAGIGLSFVGATKGIELGSNFGPIGQLVGGLAGGIGGMLGGHYLASGLNDAVNNVVNTGMGDISKGTKGAIKTAYGALLFGVLGGPAAGAIYGAAAIGGAGIILRDEAVAKSLPMGLEPGPFRI